MPESEYAAAPRPAAVPAALGWRLLAMFYDAIPLLPIALLVSASFLALHGGTPVHETAWVLAQAATLWAAFGAYFVVSWRHGGQTMGMRPWRLRVVGASGEPAMTAALWTRYAVATLSLALAGAGFAWSLVDRERRTWHDLVSGTRVVRAGPSR